MAADAAAPSVRSSDDVERLLLLLLQPSRRSVARNVVAMIRPNILACSAAEVFSCHEDW